jgi:hypothetical protein
MAYALPSERFFLALISASRIAKRIIEWMGFRWMWPTGVSHFAQIPRSGARKIASNWRHAQ